MQTTLVLMAAGFGSRFGGGVKQIEPVGPNGEVLMDYAIYDALKAGFDRVVFILRKDIEKEFRANVGKRTEKKCAVDYVYQEVTDLPAGFVLPEGRRKPWGTGQAVWACRNSISGPFCVLNADDFYGAQVYSSVYDYITNPAHVNNTFDLCMGGYVLGNTLSECGAVTRGLCHVNEKGLLDKIVETKGIELKDGAPVAPIGGEMRALDKNQVVSMNIWGMQAGFIDYLGKELVPFLNGLKDDALSAEYLLPTIVGDMVENGRGTVSVLPTPDKWFGMTFAQDKLDAQLKIRACIDAGLYPDKL